MAHNPFLSMGEPVAPVPADALNPFMMAEAEQSIFTGDNPFAASNPFSDFGSPFEPPPGDTVPMDIFGTMDSTLDNSEAKHFNDPTTQMDTNGPVDCFGSQVIESTNRMIKPTDLDLSSTNYTNAINIFSDDDDSQKPERPPLPSRPLPPETQNLIMTVTGQMDCTSSDLLDRIPPTRTPSPVSMRDIHSPSPTPDPDEDMSTSPNLFGESNIATESTAPASAFDINQNKPVRPTRPPPARPQVPPARPAPPPIPPAPVVTQPPTQQPAKPQYDDINLFDAPAPPVIKPTKEAILSLYSTPKKEEEKPIDFLSDDILENVQSTGNSPQEQVLHNESPVAPVTASIQMESQFEPTNSTSVEFDTTPQEHKMNETSGPPMDMNISNESPFKEQVIAPFSEKSPFDDASNSPSIFGNHQKQDDENVFKNSFEAESSAFGTVADVTKSVFEAETSSAVSRNTEADQWGSAAEPMAQDTLAAKPHDDFDAFSAKFDSTFSNQGHATFGTSAWGDDGSESKPEVEVFGTSDSGFEAEAYDPFLSMSAPPPPPAATPRLSHQGSRDSNDDTFSLFIRPKEGGEEASSATVPALAPPPANQRGLALADASRFNPFDKSVVSEAPAEMKPPAELTRERSGSGGETPPTPLFDEDTSVPLEDFPRTKYNGPGWEMHLRQPNKKKITGQRFWKKIFVRLTFQGDNPVVQLLNSVNDKEPFQELPLQACYSVSEVGAQQFDQFGKIFTVKLQYVFYKERPGVRPGQVTKAERITNKLSQFAAYAIQGDYQGVKEFGSDLRKLGLPVEHAPQVSQLFKLGSLNYEDVKQFSSCIEEALFRLPAHRDRALTYKMEEVQLTAVDELYVEQDAEGAVLKQIARVRIFFLGFLSGMPDVELGVNDLRRQGKEVVGRHDIIPVVTEEWIRVEVPEFHACVQPEHFTSTQIIRFKPPDACYIELMRFRVRPPKNRELPLQLKAVWCVTGNKAQELRRYFKSLGAEISEEKPPKGIEDDLHKIVGVCDVCFKESNESDIEAILNSIVSIMVELRADVLVPGFASRKLGQVPCEDVAIRFPIPECWIYLFRVEKHFRYGSVKSAHRRTGKIKGIERFLGAVDTLQESLIEVTSGQAKYEHQHRAIVWRMPRLPKEGQGAYTTHNLVCRMALTSYDQVPEELARWAHVEFTMPATQASHVTVRSVSLQNHDNDPPEKYVRHLARHEYIVGIERTSGVSQAAYVAAVAVEPSKPEAPPTPAAPQPPSSDSDSD